MTHAYSDARSLARLADLWSLNAAPGAERLRAVLAEMTAFRAEFDDDHERHRGLNPVS